MNAARREALQQAGFRLGTVQDFLGLSDWEHRLVELKYGMSKTVKRLREALGLTQQDVAKKIKSSQSRIAKIEAGATDVSLDLLVRYLFAVGGNLREFDNADAAGDARTTEERPALKKTAPARKKKAAPVS